MIRAASIVVGLALLNSAAAQRTLEVVESAAEFALSQVELPNSDTGNLTLKPCTGCPTEFHRVTPATKYFLSGSQVALVDLAVVVDEIRESNADDRALVGVFVDRASKTVTRVIVGRPAR